MKHSSGGGSTEITPTTGTSSDGYWATCQCPKCKRFPLEFRNWKPYIKGTTGGATILSPREMEKWFRGNEKEII